MYIFLKKSLVPVVGMFLMICAQCRGQSIELRLVDKDAVTNRLSAGAVANNQRQPLVEKLFREAACQPTAKPVNKHLSNVVCTLPGTTDAKIVVGAHFDFIDRGKGIVDDWSGTALLASLYQTLKPVSRTHTFEFVAFAAEERGLVGSTRFVKEMSAEEKASVRAFVNLECLGLSGTKVWASRADPVLLQRWAEILEALHVPLAGVNVEDVGDDDSHPFLQKKIPVITIHSLTQETLPILHSPKDNFAAINAAQYYDSYQAVAFYLKYLDGKLNP